METLVFRRVLPVFGGLLALSGGQRPANPILWVEDSFEDFRWAQLLSEEI